jgi:three-Cys-motif partner protein
MHLAVTQAVLRKHARYRQHYRYIDLTAGKGYSPDGRLGSPLVFLKHAESDQMTFPYYADFVEANPKNVEALETAIESEKTERGWQCLNMRVHAGRYQEMIPTILPADVDANELGMVFVDPSGDLPDFETLQYIARVRPRMEILIYISTTNIKRLYQHRHKLLSDYMAEVGKAYWLVRKPLRQDPHKWTFLLGSNAPLFKDYKLIEFMRLDSKEAQRFFPTLNLTARQRREQNQPRLLDAENLEA